VLEHLEEISGVYVGAPVPKDARSAKLLLQILTRIAHRGGLSIGDVRHAGE
jgi:hypothetical protein